MKHPGSKWSLAALLALGICQAMAQGVIGVAARSLLRDMAQEGRQEETRSLWNMAERFGLERRAGVWMVHAVALVDEGLFDPRALVEVGGQLQSELPGMRTLRLPVERLALVASLPGVLYLDTGWPASPDLEHARPDTRADSVQAGLGGLPMGYDGDGVVVGVIDWGFDYTHPVFRNAAMNGLRLSKAWDQNKTSGPPPAGYSYGAEYVGMDELLAAGADTLFVFGPLSHGTHVAGIAAGHGAGTTHVGMAPGAELVFVSYRRDPAAFIDAISWIRAHAESVGKPCVVNMSFGRHTGPHDGSSLENQAMDLMAGTGRIFVGSAGNNGTGNFHLKHNFTPPTDTVSTVIGFASGAEYWGQGLSIWGTPGSPFSLGLRITTPTNATITETVFHHSMDNPTVEDTIVTAPGDTVIVRLVGEAASPLNGKPNMILEVRRTGNQKVLLRLAGGGGEIHVWNVQRLVNRFTNWGVSLASNYPGATNGDNNYAVGEPAGVGNSVITVASHRAEQFNAQGEMLFGGRSSFSSRGPTVDGRVKPDISGPGQLVRSSVSSFDPNTAGAPQWISFEGVQYPFDTYSGTSMSGPAVAGVVALMLQANPQLDAVQAKEIIRQTARLDERTGEIGPEGSLEWGWGKVDAMGAVWAALIATGWTPGATTNVQVTVYPNPNDGTFKAVGIELKSYRVLDAQGRLVHEGSGSVEGSDHSLTLTGMKPGVYLLELVGVSGVARSRIVIQ